MRGAARPARCTVGHILTWHLRQAWVPLLFKDEQSTPPRPSCQSRTLPPSATQSTDQAHQHRRAAPQLQQPAHRARDTHAQHEPPARDHSHVREARRTPDRPSPRARTRRTLSRHQVVTTDPPADAQHPGSTTTITQSAPDCGGGLVVGEDFRVGPPRRVIDRDMDAPPADRLAGDAGSVSRFEVVSLVGATGDAVPGATLDVPDFLTSRWISSPGRSRSWWTAGSSPRWPSLPIPSCLRMSDTVESAISSVSAISGPVNRNRRSAAIASIRCAGVRCAIRVGALERSNKPCSPSSRYRPSHLRAQRTLRSVSSPPPQPDARAAGALSD